MTGADGQGAWRVFRFRAGALAPDGPLRVSDRPAPAVTVAFALTKGDRPEWTVQKLTELGVDRIVPLVSERCVVRWDPAKAARNAERFREVVRQAAMQSRQVWLPEVSPVVSFAQLVAGGGLGSVDRGGVGPVDRGGVGSADRGGGGGVGPADRRGGGGLGSVQAARLALAVPGGGPLLDDLTGVLVGPEGGWSEAEEQAGLPRVGLGPSILRAETAAVVAGVLLTARRAGLVTAGRGLGLGGGPSGGGLSGGGPGGSRARRATDAFVGDSSAS